MDLSQWINFSNFPKLETLLIDNIPVSNLNVSQNPELKTLSVLLSDEQDLLDLSTNLLLTDLEIRSPGELDLNLTGNTNLERLIINAKLTNTTLDLSEKAALKELSVNGGNTLKTLDVSSCPLLESLILSSSAMEKLDISQNTGLKLLRLNLSAVEKLDLSNNKMLEVLFITSSSLGFIHTDNSTLGTCVINQENTIALDDSYSYDLQNIPGFQASRLKSIGNAKLSGSKIYPTSETVTCNYYVNDQKHIGLAKMTLKVTSPLRPAEVKGVTISKQTATTINCNWKKLANPDGYVVYARNVDSGKVEKRIAVKKNVQSCKITGLKAGGKYAIIIRAYKKFDGKNRYSDYGGTSQKVVYTLPAKPKLKLHSSGSKIKLSWNNKKAASRSSDSGYLIYYRAKSSGRYTRLAKVPDTQGIYTVSNLKKGKTYYFKIRAYVRNQDKAGTVYSDCSNVIKKVWK